MPESNPTLTEIRQAIKEVLGEVLPGAVGKALEEQPTVAAYPHKVKLSSPIFPGRRA